MAKTICWTIIFIALAVNVVMLQWTIEAYLGLEFDLVFRNTIVALISSVVALLTMFKWRKIEYK
ncbi:MULTISPECIES: hypothetical protein [Halalkalibacter]|jgi:hypothetical protein|uniref:Uncharacterized protein n=1 Tax=Halalkalibacter alkaliphilus TaxID=2917993 RepID=A0A9X2CVP4_9BACI|nr:hypothetical protein [Halalkalibacter alkaliphilus]MCL7748709.1 hypothetical protein [Halalkalibacter alkaliphilus]